jgi:hypothetical protein
MKPRAQLKTLGLIAAIAASSVCSRAAEADASAPLVIQKQGSFVVGGTLVIAPGTFDPIKHGAFNPGAQKSAGQTLRGDHAYVSYQIFAQRFRLSPAALLDLCLHCSNPPPGDFKFRATSP